MRQMYAAMLITLNGDYRYGSIKDSTVSPQCEYHRQFFEKKCGTRDLNHYGVVCGGKVIAIVVRDADVHSKCMYVQYVSNHVGYVSTI